MGEHHLGEVYLMQTLLHRWFSFMAVWQGYSLGIWLFILYFLIVL